MSLRHQHTPSVAAAKASFSTATAYRVEADPRPPLQKQPPRSSRRDDPLDGLFEKEVVPLLVKCPALHAEGAGSHATKAATIDRALRRLGKRVTVTVGEAAA